MFYCIIQSDAGDGIGFEAIDSFFLLIVATSAVPFVSSAPFVVSDSAFQLMVSYPGFPGPSEENSGSLAQILFYSSLFNFIHVYSGLFKFIQAHSSLLKVQGLAPCSLGYWSLCYWLTS
jgi:hypothetical protein